MTTIKTTFRVDKELKELLEKYAKEEKRSMSKQLEHIIDWYSRYK